MEKFRIQCERLSSSLDECEKKLTGFEIQEDYHAADLRKVKAMGLTVPQSTNYIER